MVKSPCHEKGLPDKIILGADQDFIENINLQNEIKCQKSELFTQVKRDVIYL